MQRSYGNGWQNRTRPEEIEHIEELRQIGKPLEHSHHTIGSQWHSNNTGVTHGRSPTIEKQVNKKDVIDIKIMSQQPTLFDIIKNKSLFGKVKNKTPN